MRYFTLLIVAAFTMGCQFLNAQNCLIKGKITDSTTKEPLLGATISIQGTNVGIATNTRGEYQIKRLSTGTYTITASYVGYTTKQKIITIKDQSTELDFSLNSRPEAINEVVVTGTGTEHYLKDAPVQTEVITNQILSAYSGRSIEEILSGLSPSFDFGQNEMGSNMQMNGLGNNYILVLIDGKKVHGDVGGQNNLSMINPENVERIEVVKGASSSLYGSDAIAGVINIITKKNYNPLNIENTTRGGSYGDFQQHNTIGLKSKKWSSSTVFNLKHSDGWKNSNQEIYKNTLYPSTVTKTANRFTDYRVTEKIEFKPNEKLSAYASGMIYGKDMYRPCGEPQYTTYGMFYRSQSYDLGGKYLLSNNNFLTFDASYDKTNYSHRYTSLTVEEHIDESGEISHPVFQKGDESLQSSQERILAHLKGVFNLGKSHRLSSGIEYNLDMLKSPYRILSEKESAYTLSAYVQDEWSYRNLNITAGARLVGHKEFGAKITPKVSALYKLENVNLRATYSNGFKTPTLKELYYRYERTMMSDLRLYLGNTGLKPQFSNYYSLGAEYNSKRFTASVTGYYNRVKDMIALVEIESSYYDKVRGIDKTMQYNNIEDAKIRGIDFIFNFNVTGNLLVGGGYSYTNAEANKLNEDGVMVRLMVDGTALHHANMRFVWNHDWEKYKLGVGLFARAQSKRYYEYDGNAGGYMTWRLNTNHKLATIRNCKLEFNAGIDNIFDYHETKPYGYNYASNTAGRTYYTSVTLRFIK